MVYGIFTAGQRTWGGPRADAGQADSTTTAQAAIEQAEAMGDDLNVVPETFRSAVQSRHISTGRDYPSVSLQPSDNLKGRFRSTGSVWYPDEDALLPLRRRATVPVRIPLQPTLSTDSLISNSSTNYSIFMPRRADSLVDLENQQPQSSRSRAHPPSASSAFYDSRQEPRYGEQTYRSHSQSSRPGSEDGSVDLGSLGRPSLFHEHVMEKQNGSDIPLLELTGPTSPESGLRLSLQGHDVGMGRRGRSSLARSFSAQDLEKEELK
jgi:chitin synthase